MVVNAEGELRGIALWQVRAQADNELDGMKNNEMCKDCIEKQNCARLHRHLIETLIRTNEKEISHEIYNVTLDFYGVEKIFDFFLGDATQKQFKENAIDYGIAIDSHEEAFKQCLEKRNKFACLYIGELMKTNLVLESSSATTSAIDAYINKIKSSQQTSLK